MELRRFAVAMVSAVCLATGTLAAQAQPSTELDARIRALEEQVRQLKAELDALRLRPAEPEPTVVPATPAAPQPGPSEQVPAAVTPAAGTGSTGSRVFNPDVGVIGNFVSASGESRGGSESVAPIPFATLQESEASFQAIVDPYARADFFLAIGEEGIEVEEGFVTFNTLPGRLLLKAGKMRANFGRLNAFHNHTLPWIDRPLAMYNLLGGSPLDPDTGIRDAGISVSRLVPAGPVFVEATGELFRGDSGSLFKSHRRSDFSTVGHVRAYADVTEATNVEVGGSYARGHNDFGSDYLTQLYGTDVTLRWRPLSRAIYRSLAARTEFFWSRREAPGALHNAFGGYASVDYGFRRRWSAGARYDWSERASDASTQDRGESGILTFWPSEFSQVRGQYRRTRYGDDGRIANELLFQLLFTIGAHGAHPF